MRMSVISYSTNSLFQQNKKNESLRQIVSSQQIISVKTNFEVRDNNNISNNFVNILFKQLKEVN